LTKTYWVYILKCSDGSYYTGSTSDLESRLINRQEGSVRGYTKNRRPVELVYSEYSEDVYEIISAERQIKGWSRAKKEALINNDFDLLVRLSNKKSDYQ
jgi:predicted GIY-YIG superfamily endonuclease